MTISELFLDTEHGSASFERMARDLRALGYSAGELDDIYSDVAASLYMNTYAPLGVWAGFDPEWVMAKVTLERYRRQGILNKLRRYVVTRSTIEDWRRLRSLIATETDDAKRT
jgi:RecB family exonuclease